MLCPKCGALVADDSVFCSKCGTTLKETKAEAAAPAQETLPPPEQSVQTSASAVVPVDPVVQYARTQPQPLQGAYQPTSPVPDMYLTQNILLTVFAAICCITIFALPTAVTGLVFSAIAQGAYKQNDMDKVRQYTKLARIFMWISFGIEIGVVVIYILLLIIGVTSLTNVFQNIFKGDFNFNMDQFKDFGEGTWK